METPEVVPPSRLLKAMPFTSTGRVSNEGKCVSLALSYVTRFHVGSGSEYPEVEPKAMVDQVLTNGCI